MAKKIDVPFNGTKEQEEKLREELAQLRIEHEGKGLMIAALQKAQEIYGYLPEAVQQMIADELGVSLAEVYGVATFYAQFSLYPKGRIDQTINGIFWVMEDPTIASVLT